MSIWSECREAARYWVREVIAGAGHRRRLRSQGIDVSSVSLRRLGLAHSRAHNHANSGGPDLARVFREIGVTEGDAILDLGCGKGGALLTMAEFPFRHIAGLDMSREMLDVARGNLARVGAERVELIEGDASGFDGYERFSHIYMYNPFPQSVMRSAVDRMEASLGRKPRPLTVIYKNPRFHEEIVRNGVFRPLRTFGHSGHPFVVYEAAGRSSGS
ncbi:MAG: class I SAM-dependent methyltransferase [Armatimonadetes bacterium]|nr:class I SAM-dependent methyltransferase [Armatimonadota bacterium]